MGRGQGGPSVVLMASLDSMWVQCGVHNLLLRVLSLRRHCGDLSWQVMIGPFYKPGWVWERCLTRVPWFGSISRSRGCSLFSFVSSTSCLRIRYVARAVSGFEGGCCWYTVPPRKASSCSNAKVMISVNSIERQTPRILIPLFQRIIHCKHLFSKTLLHLRQTI